ncbi:type VII secretion integral membrane protein EccD [Aeromicrobium endophyticum]|uniref:Type VII secretion integral membrane protein EccD n=1 Tax=Aeromicrobium endophyticum TaxID=2292704 RepID=A0A371PD48_9ACTN|nr:type VII secretion integral membrane protein EccD [Aeromicrobium endophyticum]REK73310.1 type VII secretion integral membrane protein EccD [Aeromicrobium endophyticum]
MQTAYSRVTVVTAERTIDLALPSALPLSDVLPQVMRYAAPDTAPGSPTSWTLAPLGGATLALSQTLSDAGVLDGDVLELRAQQDDVRPATVEDVRDTVEDSVDASGGVWSTLTTRSYTVLLGSVLLAVLGIGSWLTTRLDGSGALAGAGDPAPAGIVVAALLFATWWAATLARVLDAQVAAATAMVWAAVLGSAIGDRAEVDTWEVLAFAVVAVAVTAGVARLLTPAATAHLAAAAVLLVVGLAHAVVDATSAPVEQATRILPVLALLTVGTIPLISLSVGGVASADYRVRHVGRLDLTALQARYRASNAVLIGSLVGIALVVVWGGIALDLRDDPWDRTLAVSLAVAATLRSRLFSRTPHMLPLRTAGLVVVAFVASRFTIEHADAAPWLAVVVAAAMLAAIGLTSAPMSDITRARVKRLLNILEFLVVVDLLVVLCGAIGIYERIGGIF